MNLENLEKLENEIAYLKEAEELLQAIYSCYDHYELRNKLEEYGKGWKPEIARKLDSHFNFDDSG